MARKERKRIYGRKRELESINALIEEVLSKKGQCLLLSGEPGIGKTTLALESEIIAKESKGFLTFVGNCYPSQEVPSYWPWSQIIGELFRTHSEFDLEISQTSYDLHVIHNVFSWLQGDEQPSGPDPFAVDGGAGRYVLFQSVFSFLDIVSNAYPVLIILDDLHNADQSSILLFEFLAKEISTSRIMLLGTYRDQEVNKEHALSSTLSRIYSNHHLHLHHLMGLNRSQTYELTASILHSWPSKELMDYIFTQTNGNPFLVRELTSILRQDSEAITWPKPLDQQLPTGLKDVISNWIMAISRENLELFRYAAILGQQFSVERLLAVYPVELCAMRNSHSSVQHIECILGMLQEATEAGLLQRDIGEGSVFSFRHALIRDAIISDLSLTTRIRMHANIAEGLDNLQAKSGSVQPEILAYHYKMAELVKGTAKIVEYSILAGERSYEASAYEEGLAFFLQAKEMIDRESPPDLRAKLFHGLARVQTALQLRDDARQSFRESFRSYLDSKDERKAVELVSNLPPGGTLVGLSDLALHALKLANSGSLEYGYVLCRLGLDLGWEGKVHEAFDALEGALKVAERLSSDDLKMKTYANMADVGSQFLQMERALISSQKASALADKCQSPFTSSLAHYHAGFISMNMGNSEDAHYHLAQSIGSSKIHKDRFRLRNALCLSAMLHYVKGEWERSHLLLSQAKDIFNDASALVMSALPCAQMNDLNSAKSCVEEFYGSYNFTQEEPVSISLGMGVLLCIASIIPIDVNLEEIKERFIHVLRKGDISPSHRARVNGCLGMIALLSDDKPLAKKAYGELNPLASVPVGFYISPGISHQRLLGQLAQFLGYSQDALNHYSNAIAFCKKGGYLPELAWTYYSLASFLPSPDLGAYDVKGRVKDASQFIKMSIDYAIQFDMEVLVEKLKSLRATYEYKSRPFNLTKRELEILSHVVDGKSNNEISETLFVSVNTVTRHLTHIYSKLGVNNRTEAARFALEDAILDTRLKT